MLGGPLGIVVKVSSDNGAGDILNLKRLRAEM
jgi:hypothetical protein